MNAFAEEQEKEQKDDTIMLVSKIPRQSTRLGELGQKENSEEQSKAGHGYSPVICFSAGSSRSMKIGGLEIMTTPTKRMTAAHVLKRPQRSPGSSSGDMASTMQGEENRIVAASPADK